MKTDRNRSGEWGVTLDHVLSSKVFAARVPDSRFLVTNAMTRGRRFVYNKRNLRVEHRVEH